MGMTRAAHRLNIALMITCWSINMGVGASKYNVLFFVVDDMRPNLGTYNYTLAHTPAMDGLAATGLRFDSAYVQFAWCSPSRNSFMTGRRPDTNRVWEFTDSFRHTRPSVQS